MRMIDTAVGQCRLIRSRRRTLAISVLPDGAVEIVAPNDAALAAILQKVEKRAGWIHRQRRLFSNMRVDRPIRRYCSGATHRYLGRQYRLKVIKAAEPSVKLVGAYLRIQSRSGARSEIESLLSRWMREKALEQFQRRLEKWFWWCHKVGVPEPKLGLRHMPKRWGSAHTNGRIYLNPELVRTPSPCIDYVIAHEVCHMKHPTHDRGFYAELERLCPNWKEMKRRLESTDL